MQFSRVITPVEDIQIWNASSNGFSFVISYESRSGPGLQGNPGFVASWRPIYQNRPAVKVIGSPRRSHQEAGPHAAGEPSLQISARTVPKKYAAGLEISCPGGACLKLGR
jgi:hypothetical protein